MRMRLLLGVLAAALLPAQVIQRREPIPPRPPVTAEEISLGKRLFQGHCGGCHGPQGGGARGPNLVRPTLRHAPDPESLFLVIDLGIEGTEMPMGNQLHDSEVWKIAAFVESLGQIEPEPLPGDPKNGEDVYYGKGNCSSCHWLGGEGGLQGPDLTDIGARRSVDYLRQSLLEPAADFPEGFLMVSVAGKDGPRIRGIRLNEGTFTIQLRDFSERLHSFLKEDLSELNRHEGESSMPAYTDTLTKAEIDNLVSFLASQRGGS
jgi:cytochrome c oxidase cbb3-type subunit 3